MSRVATRSFRGSAKGRPFVFMPTSPYTKPYLTPAQRVAHLRSRGLIVSQPAVAAGRIERIGYERLRIYFISRRQLTLPGRPFVAGTTYQDILRLYQCDSMLRELCFVAVGQFELLFRNAMSEVVSRQHGGHPYAIPSIYRDAAAQRRVITSLLNIVARSKDQRIVHYCANYSQPMLPPIWTLKEVLTFGSASHLYKALSSSLRAAVANAFGVSKEPVFQSWIECFVDLRNICAHHDRLFNRSFQKQPASLVSAAIPNAPKKKLKALLECLDHVLGHRGIPVNVTGRVGTIIGRFSEVRPVEAGY